MPEFGCSRIGGRRGARRRRVSGGPARGRRLGVLGVSERRMGGTSTETESADCGRHCAASRGRSGPGDTPASKPRTTVSSGTWARCTGKPSASAVRSDHIQGLATATFVARRPEVSRSFQTARACRRPHRVYAELRARGPDGPRHRRTTSPWRTRARSAWTDLWRPARWGQANGSKSGNRYARASRSFTEPRTRAGARR